MFDDDDRNSSTHGFARSLHDIGIAAWFGGSLMGAIGLNGGASKAKEPSERAKIARAGWDSWTPVNAAAIGAHLLGAAVLLGANKGRVAAQQGVASTAALKTVATAGALAATAYGRKLGKEIEAAPAAGSTEPSPGTPSDMADAQRKEKYVQWAIPALTGVVIAIAAKMGEQQQPSQVAKGFFERLNPAA